MTVRHEAAAPGLVSLESNYPKAKSLARHQRLGNTDPSDTLGFSKGTRTTVKIMIFRQEMHTNSGVSGMPRYRVKEANSDPLKPRSTM